MKDGMRYQSSNPPKQIAWKTIHITEEQHAILYDLKTATQSFSDIIGVLINHEMTRMENQSSNKISKDPFG